MSITTTIQGAPQPEQLTGSTVRLLAPGYTGRVERIERAGLSRAAGDKLPLAEAAAGSGVEVIELFQIDLNPPLATAPAVPGGRSAEAAAPQLVVPAQAGADYAVLYTDAAGLSQWLFPEDRAEEAPDAVFALPPSTVAAPAADGDQGGRGDITRVMRGVARVVAWVAQPLIGATARAIAGHWESGKRPYGLWQVGAGGTMVPPSWPAFGQNGPSLLLIHGTFSTPQVGFAGWVGTPAFDALSAGYGGRVLTLAHPSLSASPQDNIDWLLAQLPRGQVFGGSLDIVCHSRGGLVARELAARAAAGQAPKVDRVCQVGAPNLGTALADAGRWTVFLDAHTNCLTVLPDSVSTIVLEGLLCLVKIIGTGVARGLPGLAAMDPVGEWLKTYGARPTGDARWFTIGANYTPAVAPGSGLAQRVKSKLGDAAVDAFFAADNDMVVPSDGCHVPGPAVVDSLKLAGGAVNHVSYFPAPEVQAALARWLA